jgi:hypothetical protein
MNHKTKLLNYELRLCVSLVYNNFRMKLVKTVQWSNNCKNKSLPFPQISEVLTLTERHLLGIILDIACGKGWDDQKTSILK